MLSLRRILLTFTLFTPCLSLSTPQPTLQPRQEMETRTVDVTSSMELQGGATSVTPSSTTSYRLETATPPIQLADTIGLIMPNPWSKLYVGTFRDAIAADSRTKLLPWIRGRRPEASAYCRWMAETDPTTSDVAQ